MKNFLYRIALCVALFVLIPLIITLLAQGSGKDYVGKLSEEGQEKQDLGLDEDMLIGIVANEIAVTSEPEAMKAQAVIARTELLGAVEGNPEWGKPAGGIDKE